MSESNEERYARNQLEMRCQLRLRKQPELQSRKSYDYDMLSGDQVVAAAEVKQFERSPRTLQAGWTQLPTGVFTREDNGPSRVANKVHEAIEQLLSQSAVKVLILVNDEPMMDQLDLREALKGYLDYGNAEF